MSFAALELMVKYRVSGLPVLDDSNRVVSSFGAVRKLQAFAAKTHCCLTFYSGGSGDGLEFNAGWRSVRL